MSNNLNNILWEKVKILEPIDIFLSIFGDISVYDYIENNLAWMLPKQAWFTSIEKNGYFCAAFIDFVSFIGSKIPEKYFLWFMRVSADALFFMYNHLLYLTYDHILRIQETANNIKDSNMHLYALVAPFLTFLYDEVDYPYLSQRISIQDIIHKYRLLENKADSGITNPSITVIIPFFNSDDPKFAVRTEAIYEAIHSIKLQRNCTITIWIFVNQLKQETLLNWLKEAWVDVIYYSNDNLGAASARNVMIKHFLKYDSDYFLFLDDDIYFTDPLCISKLVNHLDLNPDVWWISPIIVHWVEPRLLLTTWYETPRERESICPRSWQIKDKKTLGEWLKSSYLLEWSCMLIPKSILIKTNLFSEDYNYYFEETLLEHQIVKDQGVALAVAQNTFITHRKLWSWVMSPHSIYYFYRNFYYYIDDLWINKNSPFFISYINSFENYIDSIINAWWDQLDNMRSRIILAKENLALNDWRKSYMNEFNPQAEYFLYQ